MKENFDEWDHRNPLLSKIACSPEQELAEAPQAEHDDHYHCVQCFVEAKALLSPKPPSMAKTRHSEAVVVGGLGSNVVATLVPECHASAS